MPATRDASPTASASASYKPVQKGQVGAPASTRPDGPLTSEQSAEQNSPHALYAPSTTKHYTRTMDLIARSPNSIGTMARICAAALIICLVGCGDLRRPDPVAAPVSIVATGPLFAGEFDNREQVVASTTAGAPAPHVVFTLQALPTDGWFRWHVRLDGEPAPLEATWAMQVTTDPDGEMRVVPHRALVADPATDDAFDPAQWTPLAACALRGSGSATSAKLSANPAACATIAPGIGTQAALLPLTVEREGEWLRVRLYADQARGVGAREDARRVRHFAGWAVINGGGPGAAASNDDWHMNRNLRLGSEGGRAQLKWRDGSASGYSLGLERMTYREGNTPVLKLSVLDDRDGRVLAYVWANPAATRIGISLGWLQVGLEEGAVAAPQP